MGISLSPFAPENLVSRDEFGSPVNIISEEARRSAINTVESNTGIMSGHLNKYSCHSGTHELKGKIV